MRSSPLPPTSDKLRTRSPRVGIRDFKMPELRAKSATMTSALTRYLIGILATGDELSGGGSVPRQFDTDR